MFLKRIQLHPIHLCYTDIIGVIYICTILISKVLNSYMNKEIFVCDNKNW